MEATENKEGLLSEEEKFQVRMVLLFYSTIQNPFDKGFQGAEELESAYAKLGGENFHQKKAVLQTTSMGDDLHPRFPTDAEDFLLLERIEESGVI